jgi:hypothetical protein
MTHSERPQHLKVLTIVVGIPLAIWLAALYVVMRGARQSVGAFGEVLSLSVLNATTTIEAWSQLKAAADLVIERDGEGGYWLSGRLLPERRRAATIAELEAIVRELPRGAALVTVEETEALLAPVTPESAAKQAQIEALMRREGFAIIRGSYEVPVLAGRRPTMR